MESDNSQRKHSCCPRKQSFRSAAITSLWIRMLGSRESLSVVTEHVVIACESVFTFFMVTLFERYLIIDVVISFLSSLESCVIRLITVSLPAAIGERLVQSNTFWFFHCNFFKLRYYVTIFCRLLKQSFFHLLKQILGS